MSRTHRWTVALGASGEVLGASPGAPPGWVGARLETLAGVPGSLRHAAGEVVSAARHGGGTLATALVDLAELDATVEIIAVAAVGLRPAATDVRTLLPYALAPLARQARALDVELSVATAPGVPPALSLDREKIAWAVSALVGNAMRFVRHGTRSMPGGSVAVTAGLDEVTGELVLVVADDGPGIAPEVRDHLFQRAPGAPHATGLALLVVRDVVTAHGGSLELTTSTDARDHGTTVTVRIPAG